MDKKKEFSRLVEKSVSRDKEDRKEPETENKRESQATKIVALLEEHSGKVKLFHDDLKKPYASIPIEEHREIWHCESAQFKQWLARRFWEEYRTAPSSDAIRNALGVIAGKARFDFEEYVLHVRTAAQEDTVWYDLSNPEWQCVKITSEGWEIVNNPPILFKRFSHQQAQTLPQKGCSLEQFLDFVNINNPDHQLLLLVYIVSCFIPGFAHPVPLIHGVQGSAKSTLSKLLRRLIDPSAIEVSELPKSTGELIQKISHHWLLFFDNISYLNQENSDILCKTVSGMGFSKRELYTNDEDIIYVFQRCIGLNGINLPATSPDLLERGILIELERIPQEKRKDETEIHSQFEKVRPLILGSIFSALSKAMSVRDSIEIDRKPRMSDFATWGCAITIALGRKQEDFLEAYTRNIESQNLEVLNDSPEASAILTFMEKVSEWSGTPSDLYVKLKDIAETQGVATNKAWGFPSAPNKLTKRLNRLKPNLAAVGIDISYRKENRQRIIVIEKEMSELEKNVREVMPIDDGDGRDDGDDTSMPF